MWWLWWACSNPDTIGSGQPPAAELQVSPLVLDFRTTTADAEGAKNLDLVVSNPGSADLELLSVTADSDRYRWAFPEEPRIQPDASITIPVTFGPDGKDVSYGTLTVGSSAGDADVVLLGDDAFPSLVVEPDAIDLAYVLVGCTVQGMTRISNEGTVPLVLVGLSIHQDDELTLTVEETGQLSEDSLNLDPGDAIDVAATYTPIDLGTDEAFVLASTNDPFSPTSPSSRAARPWTRSRRRRSPKAGRPTTSFGGSIPPAR
jgi:hypothetical protein